MVTKRAGMQFGLAGRRRKSKQLTHHHHHTLHWLNRRLELAFSFFSSLSLSVSIFVPFSLRFLRSAKNQRMPTTRQPPPGSFGECGWSLYLWCLLYAFGNQQNINNHSSSTISHRLSMMSLSFSTAHNTARPQFMHSRKLNTAHAAPPGLNFP